MGLMQSVHMRRLAVHCRAPEEEHVYADRIVEQAAYFGISTDAAVVEIKSLLGAGDDSRAGQNIAGLPCAFPGWSIVVRCVLLSALSGPVAQRLEQGTHNPLVPGSNPGGPMKISDCGMRIADLNGACGGASRSWRKSFSSAF